MPFPYMGSKPPRPEKVFEIDEKDNKNYDHLKKIVFSDFVSQKISGLLEVKNIKNKLSISLNGVDIEYFEAEIKQEVGEPAKIIITAPFKTK